MRHVTTLVVSLSNHERSARPSTGSGRACSLWLAFWRSPPRCRFWGIGFGLPHVHARPDELLIVATALGFFTSNLNPHFFDYPALYIYILFALLVVYYAWSRLAGWSTSAAHFVGGTHGRWPMFYLIGRGVSAIVGTLTVLWVYRIGRALFDRSIGLAAAIFLSLAFLHVRDSHYATTDVTMTLFVMCAMLSLVRLHQDRRSRHAWSAAIFAGLAMGTKYNAALLAVPMGVVELFHAWPQRRDLRAVLREHVSAADGGRHARHLPGDESVSAARLSQKALQDFRALQESMSVGMTPPELLGPGWIYHFRFSLVHGLGIPLLVASILGIGVAARRDPKAALLLGSFPAAYYLVAGASANVFVRYMIPIVPFLCLFAAVAVDAISLAAARATGLRQGLVGLALVVAIVAPSAWSVFQFDRLLAREDSRVMAAKWVMENVPFGSSVYHHRQHVRFSSARGPRQSEIPADWLRLPGEQLHREIAAVYAVARLDHRAALGAPVQPHPAARARHAALGVSPGPRGPRGGSRHTRKRLRHPGRVLPAVRRV
mgnify:CR=1 FL=1